MTLLLVICFFTDGTFFLFFNHSGLTEGYSVIPLADASLHLALPQNPSFLRNSKFVSSCSGFCSFWKALSWEWLLVTFRSHMLLGFSVCTQWSCSSSLRNVSNSPAFILAAPCPGLIPLVECSVVLVPYIVLSCYVAVVVSLLNMHVLRVRAHMSLLWCFKD